MVITPDGRRVVVRIAKVWDLENGRLLCSLEGHTGRWDLPAVAVTPDGRQIVSGSGDNILKVWDLQSGCLLRSLEGHTDRVNAVAVTPDGQQVVSASSDRTIKVWDLARADACCARWKAIPIEVKAVAVTPDGRRSSPGQMIRRSRCGTWRAGACCARWRATLRP